MTPTGSVGRSATSSRPGDEHRPKRHHPISPLASARSSDELDTECAQILFENINILIMYGADRDARTRFNAKVNATLDALPTAEQAE